MLKTVYRSNCRNKHNCQRHDSNLDPLTAHTAVRQANHSATETCYVTCIQNIKRELLQQFHINAQLHAITYMTTFKKV